MKPIILPSNFNYIAAFLTFSCQLRCSYCINHHGGDLVKGRKMSKKDWINGLNRIQTRADLPITIQGGEPTVYKYFYEVIAGVKSELPIDLLTNLEVDIERFRNCIPPDRLRRTSPYASIRVSYHHGQSDFKSLTTRVKYLSDLGYHIGIWEVDCPDYHNEVIVRQQIAHSLGIDYRLKEFLGPWKGVNYGTMRYDDAVNSPQLRCCLCRTSELLIDPSGHIFRCHSDLYANRSPIGHLLDPEPELWKLGGWRECSVMGKCNSCDIKLKTDRFQNYGHSSVEIKCIGEAYAGNQQIQQVINTYGRSLPTTSSTPHA